MPHYFRGDDTNWTRPDGSQGRSSERTKLDGAHCQGLEGIVAEEKFAGIVEIKRKHDVAPVSVWKSAFALLNGFMAGRDSAVFMNAEAGREWPLVDDWISDRLGSALEVAGPTLECVVNYVKFKPETQIVDFVKQIQADQKMLTKYAHAPLKEIAAALSSEDADVYIDALQRQSFNWVPGLASYIIDDPKAELQSVQMQSRADVGLQWNCTMRDKETFYVHVAYDDAQLRASEVRNALRVFFEIGRFITSEQNWGATIADCLEAISA